MEHIVLAFVFVMLVGAISIAVSLDMKVDRLQAENAELRKKLESPPNNTYGFFASSLDSLVQEVGTMRRRIERLEARQSKL